VWSRILAKYAFPARSFWKNPRDGWRDHLASGHPAIGAATGADGTTDTDVEADVPVGTEEALPAVVVAAATVNLLLYVPLAPLPVFLKQ
jgi:hypothetical protein